MARAAQATVSSRSQTEKRAVLEEERPKSREETPKVGDGAAAKP